jgi:hypothetical protein
MNTLTATVEQNHVPKQQESRRSNQKLTCVTDTCLQTELSRNFATPGVTCRIINLSFIVNLYAIVLIHVPETLTQLTWAWYAPSKSVPCSSKFKLILVMRWSGHFLKPFFGFHWETVEDYNCFKWLVASPFSWRDPLIGRGRYIEKNAAEDKCWSEWGCGSRQLPASWTFGNRSTMRFSYWITWHSQRIERSNGDFVFVLCLGPSTRVFKDPIKPWFPIYRAKAVLELDCFFTLTQLREFMMAFKGRECFHCFRSRTWELQ